MIMPFGSVSKRACCFRSLLKDFPLFAKPPPPSPSFSFICCMKCNTIAWFCICCAWS